MINLYILICILSMRVPIEVLQPGRSRSILLTQIWIFVLSQQTNRGTSIAKAPQKSAWICHSFAAPTAFKSQGKRRRWCSMPENQTIYDYVIVNFDGRVCMKARARHSRFFFVFSRFEAAQTAFHAQRTDGAEKGFWVLLANCSLPWHVARQLVACPRH